MGKGFNGTAITFPSTSTRLNPVTDITHNQSGAVIAIGGSTSAGYVYEDGLTDESVEITVQGGSTVTKGSTGQVKAIWNDGSSNTLISKAVVISVNKTGSVDSPISSSITFRPRST